MSGGINCLLLSCCTSYICLTMFFLSSHSHTFISYLKEFLYQQSFSGVFIKKDYVSLALWHSSWSLVSRPICVLEKAQVRLDYNKSITRNLFREGEVGGSCVTSLTFLFFFLLRPSPFLPSFSCLKVPLPQIQLMDLGERCYIPHGEEEHDIRHVPWLLKSKYTVHNNAFAAELRRCLMLANVVLFLVNDI